MAYSLSSWDVCVQGFERLRSYNEFMLTAYVNLESTPADIKYQLEADVQSCMREEHFDYDEAQRIIDEFVKDLSAIDPFDLKETEDEGEELGEGCMLFLYVRDDNEEHEFPVY